MISRTLAVGATIACLCGAVLGCTPRPEPTAELSSGALLKSQGAQSQLQPGIRVSLQNADFQAWEENAFDIPRGWGTNRPDLISKIQTDDTGLAVSLGQPSTYVAIAQYAEIPSLSAEARFLALQANVRTNSPDSAFVKLHISDGDGWDAETSLAHPGDGAWHTLRAVVPVPDNFSNGNAKVEGVNVGEFAGPAQFDDFELYVE